MSTKICRFGVPPETADEAILAACARLFAAGERYEAYVGIQAQAECRQRKWFYLLVSGLEWALEEVAEYLAQSFPDLTALLWMDNIGLFKLEHYRGGDAPRLELGLTSEGPAVYVYAGSISGDYPQLKFSWRELRALEQKDEEQLSEREVAAIAEYTDAVRMGLAELFPKEGSAFLSVGYEPEVHALVLDGEVVTPRPVAQDDLPRGLDNLPHDWEGMPVEEGAGGAGELDGPDAELRAARTRARQLHQNDEWAELLQQAQENLERYPALRDECLEYLYQAHEHLGQLSQAMETVGQLLLSPHISLETRGVALYNRACYYVRLGQLEDALNVLKNAIRIDPQHAADAPEDDDFAPLWQDPRFIELCGSS